MDGCEEHAVAIRRADAFAHAVSQKGVEDATFWSAKASDYLRAYFHAAALAGAGHAGRGPVGRRRTTRTTPSRSWPRPAPEQWAMTLAELRGEAQKTASTVRMVMSRALSFMADPALAASRPARRRTASASRRSCASRGTLYMIADSAHEEAPVAPLFAAMAGEIHYQAAQLGQASPGGRLDPPLLMGLDEVTQICPVPLPVWLSDSRRQGHPGLRGRARRGAAGRPLGRPGQAGRPGHLLGQDLPARHHRHQDPRRREQAVRPGRVEANAARTTTPATTSPPRT